MTLVITHATVTNAVADPTAIVDGPAWDANHTLTGVVSPAQGGTGIVNNDSSTITISGSFGTTFTVTAATSVTLPTTGTLATLAGTEELTNKTLNASVAKGTWTASGTWTIPAVTLGGTVSGGGNQINNVIIGTSTPLAGSFTSLAYSTTLTGTSTSASALAVGRQGATDPVLLVDASTASVATGVKVKGAAAAGGVAVSAISSGTNENLTVDAKGSGTITLGGTSTGNIVVSRALNYGGVTLSNAVTGTGNMVLSASPTFTGTIVAGAASLQGQLNVAYASPNFTLLDTGTSYSYFQIQNAAGTNQMRVGSEQSGGGALFGGSATLASVIGSTVNTPLQMFTNNALRVTIAGGGDVSVASTTASTSTATGSLITAGGFGAAGSIFSGGALGTKTPQTLTGTSGTVAATESAAIFNASGTFTATLPAAATYPGRWLYVKNIAAQTVNSASSNVVPVAGGSAGTALLTATAGKWAILQSNGTNWEIFASN